MRTKRITTNEYIIKQFLSDDIKGYSATFNGEWYFTLRNASLYGGKILELRTDMGTRIIQLNNDNVSDCAFEIQQTLINLDKIIEQNNALNEYCTKNPWTYANS